MKIKLLSRHPTHRAIRRRLPQMPFRVVVRLGSQTEVKKPCIELNTIAGVKNASDKLSMKQCFDAAGVKTAPWWKYQNYGEIRKFPVVAKHRLGSRGTGVYKLNTKKELDAFVRQRGVSIENYIFERFKPYSFEYRCHAWEDGIFYTCRKARKRGLPEGDRWKYNYAHTVWLKEDNANFKKPKCWAAINEECKKAVAACGLTFGGCDVKVNKAGTKFYILEINSAPSFGDTTSEKYIEMLPIMARREHEKLNK